MDPITGHYTLTGASDWPMLATVGGISLFVFQTIILILIAVVYRSLPKHQDLQVLRTEINTTVKELTKSFSDEIKELTHEFANMLEKHLNKEVLDRKETDQGLVASCLQHRQECQNRNTELFAALLNQNKNMPVTRDKDHD